MAETETSTPASAENKAPTPRGGERRHPLATLREEMDRLFDDFLGSALMPLRRRDWGLAPWRRRPGVSFLDEAHQRTADEAAVATQEPKFS